MWMLCHKSPFDSNQETSLWRQWCCAEGALYRLLLGTDVQPRLGIALVVQEYNLLTQKESVSTEPKDILLPKQYQLRSSGPDYRSVLE